ncbi:MAG TPA: sensor histidine kinase, partial [Ktedonobacter sp.]|nr:sensor histidine kinase [Ktedonobacter sp.]
QRQQTKWVIYGLTVTIICDLIVALPVFLFPSAGSTLFGFFYGLFFETAITFFTFLIPISFGIAILRNRLWDIDIIINRTLVY